MFDVGDNGDGAKDTATCAMIGERGMMVAMGHGLCVCFGVCGETTKNKEESKNMNMPYHRAYKHRQLGLAFIFLPVYARGQNLTIPGTTTSAVHFLLPFSFL